jgi:hypothetical protein
MRRGEEMRFLQEMVSADNDHSSIVVSFDEDTMSYSDRDGRLDYTVESGPDGDVVWIDVLDRDGGVLWTNRLGVGAPAIRTKCSGLEGGLTLARPAELNLLSLSAQPLAADARCPAAHCVTTGWDQFTRCMPSQPEQGRSFECGGSILLAIGGCFGTSLSGGALIAACVGTVGLVGYYCGELTGKCFLEAIHDYPADCAAGWIPSGQTQWVPYADGEIQVTRWAARLDCSDDRKPCCVYPDNNQTIYAVSGQPAYTAIVCDCGGNATEIAAEAPAISQAELDTFRSRAAGGQPGSGGGQELEPGDPCYWDPASGLLPPCDN